MSIWSEKTASIRPRTSLLNCPDVRSLRGLFAVGAAVLAIDPVADAPAGPGQRLAAAVEAGSVAVEVMLLLRQL